MIRHATRNDTQAIETLIKSEPDLWQDSWRADVIERALAASDGLAFVWEESGQIVGFACAHDIGFRGYLSELVVKESSRRRGIARMLVETTQHELATRGCAILISDVWRGAEPFYKCLGWSEPDVTLLRKKLDA